MIDILLTEDKLDPAAVAHLVASETYGAGVLFIGTVRNSVLDKQVLYLDYFAYRPMAEKELTAIADEAAAQWQCAVAVAHRIGRIVPGEASIVVAAGSEHRGSAFDACRWIMDAIKARVPIWKKEVFVGGTHWVEGSMYAAIFPGPDVSLK